MFRSIHQSPHLPTRGGARHGGGTPTGNLGVMEQRGLAAQLKEQLVEGVEPSADVARSYLPAVSWKWQARLDR